MITAVKNNQNEFVSKAEYDALLQKYHTLQTQLSELQRMLFGVKSERFVPADGQIDLFTGTALAQQEKEQKQEITYTRGVAKNKQKPVRTEIPSHLPRIEEVIEPADLEPDSKKIGEEITEILEYNPANIYVRKIIRPKYVNSKSAETAIVIAPLPCLPLPKSNAGAGMLAHIAVSKFIDHLPFYRQIQIFKRQQLDIAPSTIGGWFNATCTLMEPLYAALEKQVLQNADYLQADESPIGVQDSHKKGTLHQGYMWLFRNPKNKLVLFLYNKGRSRAAPEKVLENFTGTLQTDGYKVYQSLNTKGEITLLGCMAHARRYFEKAQDNDTVRATYFLKKIQQLYAIERNAKEKQINHLTLYRYRQLYALPILNQIENELTKISFEVLPKSSIGKAIAYTLKIYANLKRYIEDGAYEIDNNNIENAVRPLALGRKNYLFAGSHQSAQNTAMMYSFFASCKANHINPYKWLNDILNRLPEHKANKIHELLPDNWKPIEN